MAEEGLMSGSAASFWSAMAATFSAIAACSIWRIQHINMLDAVRPEIVLDGWERAKRQSGQDYITIKSIKNVGKGPGLHTTLFSSKMEDAPLLAKRISILPAGDKQEINGELRLYWKNATAMPDGQKWLFFSIEILSWCLKNQRHHTQYKIMVNQRFIEGDSTGQSEIAPGVQLSSRVTESNPVWQLKLYKKISKIPCIGGFMPKV
jgi:hypothetical protein